MDFSTIFSQKEKKMITIKSAPILAKKCSEHIKLKLTESILILPIFWENSVNNRYFREK